MIKLMKPLTIAFAAAALFLQAPRLGFAETHQYCYDHPSDHSNYCHCYRHPKECNSKWRANHPDWNRRPDEAQWHHHHHHNQAYYNQGHPANSEGQYHGPPPYPGNGHPNDYNQGGQQYH